MRGPGGPSGETTFTVPALVDTGAESAMMPEKAALRIGLDPDAGVAVQIATAGGIVVRPQLDDVELEIGTARLRAVVSFGPDGTQPVIGRSTLFSFLEVVGFRYDEWLLKYGP